MSKHLESFRRDPGRVRHVVGAVVRLVVNPTLLLNVVAPVIAYQLLTRHGVGSTAALMYAAGFPLLAIAVAAVRNRRLDPLALLAFVAIAAGLVAGLVLGDGRILLVKDSIVTAALGVVFLLSLLARQPMVFVLQRRLLSRGGGVERSDRAWADSRVRARSRRTTALWGVVLIAEAAIRVALSFAVSPGTLLVISPLLAAVAFGPLALWTLRQRPKPGQADSPGTNAGASHGPTSLGAR